MKQIRLSNGTYTQVDDEDFEHLNQFRWFPSGNGVRTYAVRVRPKTRGYNIAMHRELTDAQPGKDVDHIDGNTLNNQRSNLRVCSRAENTRNSLRRYKNFTSHFKGVHFDKRYKKPWRASVRVLGKLFFTRHATEDEAAKSHDELAKKHHGEFAYFNLKKYGI